MVATSAHGEHATNEGQARTHTPTPRPSLTHDDLARLGVDELVGRVAVADARHVRGHRARGDGARVGGAPRQPHVGRRVQVREEVLEGWRRARKDVDGGGPARVGVARPARAAPGSARVRPVRVVRAVERAARLCDGHGPGPRVARRRRVRRLVEVRVESDRPVDPLEDARSGRERDDLVRADAQAARARRRRLRQEAVHEAEELLHDGVLARVVGGRRRGHLGDLPVRAPVRALDGEGLGECDARRRDAPPVAPAKGAGTT